MAPIIESKLKEFKQEHLLRFKNEISNDENDKLMDDISSVDFSTLCKSEYFCEDAGKAKSLDELLEPLDSTVHQSISRTSPEELKKFRQLGLAEIAKGKVAALLLAGGQGTRLGSSLPKGMYNVGLPSQKSLYQIQAERIVRLQELAKQISGKKAVIPWYIMTSEATKEPTVDFFQKNNYFGLDSENVMIFNQFTIPCFTFDGKIILNQKWKLARSPNGNGGLYEAIRKRGVLDDMKKRGIEHVQAYCVDNILVKVADPTFIGYCITKGAECGAKVVEKVNPTESVGIICKVKGQFKVVEYSEVSLETSQKTNKDGRLLYNAGNICNHYFTLNFLTNKVKEDDLQYHIARKKIPYIDDKGNRIEPEKPNGIKLEKFIFDVFQFADPKKFAVWEVKREDEFSPLKNNDKCDKDTPTTARMSLFDLHRRYILEAGGNFKTESSDKVPNGNTNSDNKGNSKLQQQIVCEISPLISYDGEDLQDLVRDKTFKSPLYLK